MIQMEAQLDIWDINVPFKNDIPYKWLFKNDIPYKCLL